MHICSIKCATNNVNQRQMSITFYIICNKCNIDKCSLNNFINRDLTLLAIKCSKMKAYWHIISNMNH